MAFSFGDLLTPERREELVAQRRQTAIEAGYLAELAQAEDAALGVETNATAVAKDQQRVFRKTVKIADDELAIVKLLVDAGLAAALDAATKGVV